MNCSQQGREIFAGLLTEFTANILENETNKELNTNEQQEPVFTSQELWSVMGKILCI